MWRRILAGVIICVMHFLCTFYSFRDSKAKGLLVYSKLAEMSFTYVDWYTVECIFNFTELSEHDNLNTMPNLGSFSTGTLQLPFVQMGRRGCVLFL